MFSTAETLREKGETAARGKEMERGEEWKESCFMLKRGKNTRVVPQIWKEDTILLCLNVLLGGERAGTADPPHSR